MEVQEDLPIVSVVMAVLEVVVVSVLVLAEVDRDPAQDCPAVAVDAWSAFVGIGPVLPWSTVGVVVSSAGIQPSRSVVVATAHGGPFCFIRLFC